MASNASNISGSYSVSLLPLINPYIAAYLITVVCASILSNCAVLIVMLHRKKKLRTFQLCLISICTSDLLFSICLHPMSIASALGYDAKSIFNHFGCLYFGTMALFFGTYDMVIHSLVAVLRYINLCRPAKVQWVSKRSIVSLLLLCAFYSMTWSIGPVFGLGNYETFEVGCTIAFTDQTQSGRAFVNCAFVFVFFIPLGLTIGSYVMIVMEVMRQRQLLEKIGKVTVFGSKRLNVEIKLVRVTSVIAAAYIIAWLPYAVVCLWEAYGNPQFIPPIYKILAALFCKTATATNPIIYFYMSKDFRKELVETAITLFKCKRSLFNFLLNDGSRSSTYSASEISLHSSWLNKIRNESRKLHKSITSSSSEPVHTLAETNV